MYHIKQENFNKRPTSEQRKVLRVIGEVSTGITRIEAHLKIRTKLATSREAFVALNTWRYARAIDRAHVKALREESSRNGR